VHLIGNSLGGWLAAEILIRDRSRFDSLVQLAPAGMRVKGVPCGDNFIWGPEEAVRERHPPALEKAAGGTSQSVDGMTCSRI
jgi:pimeloyl-ACP methyl ester carboxylesterase